MSYLQLVGGPHTPGLHKQHEHCGGREPSDADGGSREKKTHFSNIKKGPPKKKKKKSSAHYI